MLQVSTRTVKRRLHDFGIKLSGKFCVISDEELDREVELILVEFPNSGYKKMRGYLTSNMYNIQEYRVRESMRRVDPEGVMLRTLQSRPVVRRKYKVAGPLSLWHHDGNHKLIAYYPLFSFELTISHRTFVNVSLVFKIIKLAVMIFHRGGVEDFY